MHSNDGTNETPKLGRVLAFPARNQDGEASVDESADTSQASSNASVNDVDDDARWGSWGTSGPGAGSEAANDAQLDVVLGANNEVAEADPEASAQRRLAPSETDVAGDWTELGGTPDEVQQPSGEQQQDALARLRAKIAEVESGTAEASEPTPTTNVIRFPGARSTQIDDATSRNRTTKPPATPRKSSVTQLDSVASPNNVVAIGADRSHPVEFEPAGIDEPNASDDLQAQIDDAKRLLTKALARSDKSLSECSDMLRRDTELDDTERMQLLDEFCARGYIDDSRLAEQLVSGALSRKGLGRTGMERELRKRGLDDVVIDDALGEFDRDAEYDQALEIAVARASRLRGVEPEAATRRLYSFLARRGFSGELVGRVVNEALGNRGGRPSGGFGKSGNRPNGSPGGGPRFR